MRRIHRKVSHITWIGVTTLTRRTRTHLSMLYNLNLGYDIRHACHVIPWWVLMCVRARQDMFHMKRRGSWKGQHKHCWGAQGPSINCAMYTQAGTNLFSFMTHRPQYTSCFHLPCMPIKMINEDIDDFLNQGEHITKSYDYIAEC